MNEETTVPTEETVPESVEPLTTESQETTTEETDGTVDTEPSVPETTQDETVPWTDPSVPETSEETIWEDFSGTAYEETVAETTEPVIIDVIETVGTDLAHVSLFGSFLISGTLIGLFLLRGIHGS